MFVFRVRNGHLEVVREPGKCIGLLVGDVLPDNTSVSQTCCGHGGQVVPVQESSLGSVPEVVQHDVLECGDLAIHGFNMRAKPWY